MKIFFNILNIDIIKDVFTKYKSEDNCRIYYDLYDYKNKEFIILGLESDNLSYYENNKLYIQSYNIYTLIDSLLLSSIFNFEIIMPDINTLEIKNLNLLI